MNHYISPPSMPSSSSYSSLVRNPYGHTASKLELESLSVKCRCGIPAPCQEAWKEGTLDPGRRFFGCSRLKDPRQKCDLFLWADPPYSDRARDVIKELKMKLKKKDDEIVFTDLRSSIANKP